MAFGPRLGVFGLTRSGGRLRLGPCRWASELATTCQWLQFDAAGGLRTGGHRPSRAVEAGDWDACIGGRVESFAADDGTPHSAFELPEETAWGCGADPLVLSFDYREVYVLGRDASLHIVEVGTRAARRIYDGTGGQAGAAEPSLGIGHAAMCTDRIDAGFSRGGFRLRRYDVPQA